MLSANTQTWVCVYVCGFMYDGKRLAQYISLFPLLDKKRTEV